MTRTVSPSKAQKVVDAVAKLLSADEAAYLRLRDYTHEEQSKGSWSIAAELSNEWPMKVCEKFYLDPDLLPEGVFVEPMTSWCLGVYPN